MILCMNDNKVMLIEMLSFLMKYLFIFLCYRGVPSVYSVCLKWLYYLSLMYEMWYILVWCTYGEILFNNKSFKK